MTDSSSLPNFPTIPIVVDVKRRLESPGRVLLFLFRILLFCTYFFERFRYPRTRRCSTTERCSTSKSITLYGCTSASTTSPSNIEVERLFSPLDDEQFKHLQRVSERLSADGEDAVIAVWETLLASDQRQSSNKRKK